MRSTTRIRVAHEIEPATVSVIVSSIDCALPILTRGKFCRDVNNDVGDGGGDIKVRKGSRIAQHLSLRDAR